VAVVQTRRNLPEALPPHVKSLNYLNNILAKMEATALGAYDAVLLNSSGGGDRRDNQQCVRSPWRPPSDAGSMTVASLAASPATWCCNWLRELEIPTEETRLTAADLPIADEPLLVVWSRRLVR